MLSLITRWSSFYADHQLVSVGVTYLHLVALVIGGGTAFVADRTVLQAFRADPQARNACLQRVATSHATVTGALAVIGLSGVLMFAADLETFLYSTLFWTKMGLVVLLAVNGIWILTLERRLMRRPDWGWNRLVVAAVFSLMLWMALLLAGTWLPVAA